jgi:hypothetical protein
VTALWCFARLNLHFTDRILGAPALSGTVLTQSLNGYAALSPARTNTSAAHLNEWVTLDVLSPVFRRIRRTSQRQCVKNFTPASSKHLLDATRDFHPVG